MLSVKENFLRTLRGDEPAFVPRFDLFWTVRPSVLDGTRRQNRGRDIFGVEWTNDGSAVEATMPKTSDFILEDIRDWPEVIRFPDFSAVDFEALAKKDLGNRNPEWPLGSGTVAQGFFQSLMSFMGFTNGLIACYEEPEEVKALMQYLCDHYLNLAEDCLKYYKPDYIYFADDIAHERNPFISPETFRDIFAPVWRRYIGFFKERGLPAIHHNCGHFEAFLDDVVDMGFNMWEPAQTSNDLVAVKKKYGNRLVIGGGLDTRTYLLPHLAFTEEGLRDAVKTTMDALAPGGGYCFMGGGGAREPNPVIKQRWEWINDEYERRKATYYG